ncbi:MAG: hypothetical protein AB1Z98_29590 [Nannocystaceae bacterium]
MALSSRLRVAGLWPRAETHKTAGLTEELAVGTRPPGDVDAAVSFELTAQ